MTCPRPLNDVCLAQRGQILVLGMVLAGLALVAFTRYFHTGQVVAARARQIHSLDAATYSGALVQARALNTLSYINRAQIGHHIAMAHLVTLGSWASLSGTEAQQLARGNPPSYLIAMLFGADHGAAYMAAAQAVGFHGRSLAQGDLGAAYSSHDRTVRQVLIAAQDRIAQSVPQARLEAMHEVLKQNFKSPGFDVPYIPTAPFDVTLYNDQWKEFLQRNPGGELRQFLLQSTELYRFLAPRNHTARNSWVVHSRCPARRHELRRRGNTQLDSQGRWHSADTQSFHALRSNRWIGCYFREYAMGWGWIPTAASQSMGDSHVIDPPDNFSQQDFWRWVKEQTDWDIHSGRSNPLATSRAVAGRSRWHGGGLQAFFDTRDPFADQVGFSASLTHPGPEGTSITTHSAAEAFFHRPQPRQDSRHEHANLFRPYWQARLSVDVIPANRHKGSP